MTRLGRTSDSSESGPVAEGASIVPISAKLSLADKQNISVLIADDHPLNRTLLKRQLDALGLHVEAAADGVEALSRWQNRHFDLLITDCQMPRMDGYELAHRIRELEQQSGMKRVPIIAWTASTRAEEKMHCLAAGMDDMLTKSTDVSGFREKLLAWLHSSGVLEKP